jgi:SAM-dependent methyltransferase
MKQQKIYIKTRDYFLTQEEFSLVYTEKPGVLKTNPVPKTIWGYYESEEYLSHKNNNKTIFARTYSKIQSLNSFLKYLILRNLSENEDLILDYGAGSGSFANYVRKKGYNVQTFEPNERAQKEITYKDLTQIHDLQNIKPQIITLWHVLEHTPDPNKILKDLTEILSYNGFIILALPNYKSFDCKYYKEYWAGYDVPRHLWHFSLTGIQNLIIETELKLTSTTFLPFDAYYIALLSEKYRGNKLRVIRAIIIATISNIAALFTKEWSSRIYILKKERTMDKTI